ncbi:hypothetical protein SPRG_13402 [Saprolegnia parasitica CBS 223.65]|uniref:AAA+ ATPase domain-containing protein n=1 Tax=Saprolegnia parasitica (strain CBS 223.65) TaxID=695850 RepID=A0A067BQ92_SAPPC|nr:hypothetical protein SPRG_13402 [Saprolegnia parasitica CBS 223.65]KDO20649.1 hypothetical protein SPRG_13402 [Saprolegnia parasitica CBS 223.65]|eukprot:XP_012208615.1 hypothetical protein SPRG_13402 [Saprolegnia parasitica CBS 223.65]
MAVVAMLRALWEKSARYMSWKTYAMLAVFTLASMLRRVAQWRPRPTLLFSTFLKDAMSNNIQHVSLAGEFFQVTLKQSLASGVQSYRIIVPPRTDQSYIVDILCKHGIDFGTMQPSLSKKALPVLLAVIPIVYLGLTYRMLQGMMGGSEPGIGKDGMKRGKLNADAAKQQRISFADVAGIDKAKKELEEVVDFLKRPQRYETIGAKIPKGVLLCGPSGTGKTLLARAVAAEAGVAFLYCSASDFVEMLVGRGASRVRDLFTQASQHPKCIIFIDELDALAKARGGLNSNDEREQTLNQLLTEMDGFEGHTEGVIVIAATNRPHVLDPALCRPGRFDRHVYVGLPDAKGREAILRVHMKRIRAGLTVTVSAIAKNPKLDGSSGAQLACLVNEAALLAVRHGATVVEMHHFELAIDRMAETSNVDTLYGAVL